MNVWPALRRFFRSNQELADAACMGRTRLWMIQRGEAEFTDQEKAAIARAIKLKELKVNVEAADLDKYKRKDLI
jgi:hypothetical protein